MVPQLVLRNAAYAISILWSVCEIAYGKCFKLKLVWLLNFCLWSKVDAIQVWSNVLHYSDETLTKCKIHTNNPITERLYLFDNYFGWSLKAYCTMKNINRFWNLKMGLRLVNGIKSIFLKHAFVWILSLVLQTKWK